MYKILQERYGKNFGKNCHFNVGDEVELDDALARSFVSAGAAEKIVKHPAKDKLETKPAKRTLKRKRK